MKIDLARHSGFCMGVRDAVMRIVTELNDTDEEIFVYGPLIHNPQTVHILEKRGLKTIKTLDDIDDRIIAIRTHGIPLEKLRDIKARSRRYINLTCPRVSKVQGLIKKYSGRGHYTIIVGDADHAEVMGLKSYASAGVTVVSSVEDIEKIPPARRYIVVSQTTQDKEHFSRMVKSLEKRFPEMLVFNTICDPTHRRQDDIRLGISRNIDALVVVGGKQSANTARLARMAEHFPVLVVTGARQVGKTTLVRHLFASRAQVVVLDPVLDPLGAREDPEFFLDRHPPPLVLDEVQVAPALLGAIKRRVDEDPTPGQYILTGSQNLALLRRTAESLAGRAGVVDLEPLTVGEQAGLAREGGWLREWLDAPDTFARRGAKACSDVPLLSLLWRGGFPGLLDRPDALVPEIFDSYLRTYVERDVRLAGDIRDIGEFGRFLGLCAGLSAQEINHSQLGREIGVTPQTSARWLDTLKATGLWSETTPWHGNTLKRLSRRGKGYLTFATHAWLARNGPGLHHFCLNVEDVGEAMKASPVPTAPRSHQGTRGKRAVFLDPAATQGVQVELTGK